LSKGKVIRAAGGFFAVCDETGNEYLCRARGNLKRGSEALMVGDNVIFHPLNQVSGGRTDEGIIEKRLARFNRLGRPPVANINQLVVVMAFKDPGCDWQLVSRMLVQAEKEDMAAFLCLNKADLVNDQEIEETKKSTASFPYPIIYSSAVTKLGIDEIAERLKDCTSVFAGPSGVGKSSLLNAIQPGLSLQTGDVSEKIKRGRHTTRLAELIPMNNGGKVVDTPGFSRLSFSDLDENELALLFPDFENLRGQCNFRNCRHAGEPGCAIEENVGKKVNSMRYEHYRLFLDEISKQEAY